MKTIKDIIMAGTNLNAKVMLNVNGKDVEIKEILVDCIDETLYLYDRELDDPYSQ